MSKIKSSSIYFHIWSVVFSFMLSINGAYAQLDCEEPVPDDFTKSWVASNRPLNLWTGYVFQINSNFRADPSFDWNKNFTGMSNADPKFKGYLLRDDNDFLPIAGLNFDTQFSDYTTEGLDEGNFFPTGISPTEPGGCDTELQHFGVILRTRYVVPKTGIYLVSVGSDDGSFLDMYYRIGGVNTTVVDVNGNKVGHNNWHKDGSDGQFAFVYDENIRNYYVPLEKDDIIWMNLRYYEKRGRSRLSFELDLYVGPGEIAIGTNANGSESYCGVAPDPPAFLSLGPAVFEDGTEPNYQWQYALVNDPNPNNWFDIAGANGLTYDIPQYDHNDPSSWTGTRYFRRVAYDGTGVNFPSNVLEINLSTIEELDQEEYGENGWIGHIYDGIGNFTTEYYLGRHTEPMAFEQTFMDSPYTGPFGQENFTPEYGCSFFIDEFTVRYKMRMDIEPGTYQFTVSGDDAFRLSLDGGNSWAINEWRNSFGRTAPPVVFETTTDTVLYFVLDYYENKQNQFIKFDYEFTSIVLPLVWGEVAGNPCGQTNCLNWETLQEKNTSHFVLEKSTDGINWDVFGEKIEAQGGSNRFTTYQYKDLFIDNPITYYRIMQVDMDQSFDYSETIRVDNMNSNKETLPYPNPTYDLLHLHSKDRVKEIYVISQDQKINTKTKFEEVREGRYTLDMGNFARNHYMITVITEKGKKTYKIIKK